MSKGKHSATVNRQLREEIADLKQQLRRSEHTEHEAVAAAAGLRSKLGAYDESHHPAIEAERARADAAHEAAEAATRTERERWEAICDAAAPDLVRLCKAAFDSDRNVFSEAGMAALAELFGSRFGEAVAAGSGKGRASRRNTKNGAAVRKLNQLMAEARGDIPPTPRTVSAREKVARTRARLEAPDGWRPPVDGG